MAHVCHGAAGSRLRDTGGRCLDRVPVSSNRWDPNNSRGQPGLHEVESFRLARAVDGTPLAVEGLCFRRGYRYRWWHGNQVFVVRGLAARNLVRADPLCSSRMRFKMAGPLGLEGVDDDLCDCHNRASCR